MQLNEQQQQKIYMDVFFFEWYGMVLWLEIICNEKIITVAHAIRGITHKKSKQI